MLSLSVLTRGDHLRGSFDFIGEMADATDIVIDNALALRGFLAGAFDLSQCTGGTFRDIFDRCRHLGDR